MAGMQARFESSGSLQADLFAPADDGAPHLKSGSKARSPSSAISHTTEFNDEEAMARRLEETGRYRILRQLVPRPVVKRDLTDAVCRIGIILDTETTGLDPEADEIIELGMVAFTYDENGIGDVIDIFSQLREPSVPISPQITAITGITGEMVEGRTINLDAVSSFIEKAGLIIAHNARFDRPFCERLLPAFKEKAWACTVAEVDWGALGFEGSKLVYLIAQSGLFHNGHRAVDDCHALLEVMACPSRTKAAAPFAQLVRSAGQERLRLYAQGSPFETKDALKARGYFWNDGSDGHPKSWWVELGEEDLEAELSFLRETIYRSNSKPVIHRLSAYDRYRG